MKENDRIYSKTIRTRKTGMALLFLFNLFLFISCDPVEQDGNQDFGSYDFWTEFLQEEGEGIDFLVEWSKRNDYFTSMSVTTLEGDDGIHIEPLKKKIREKIQEDEDYIWVRGFLYKNKLGIENNWSSNKNIVFFRRFFVEGRGGSYVLVYKDDDVRYFSGNELKENEEYYRKVSKNFYSRAFPNE